MENIQITPNFVYDPDAAVQIVARVVPVGMFREVIMLTLNPHIDMLMRTFKLRIGDHFSSELRDWKQNEPDVTSSIWHRDSGSGYNTAARYCAFWSNTTPTEVCTLPDLKPVVIHPCDLVLMDNTRCVHRFPPDALNDQTRWFYVARAGSTDKYALDQDYLEQYGTKHSLEYLLGR